MIKCEVIIKYFTLEKFDELKNITRANIDEKGKLFKGDTFDCTKEMAEYLAGCNPLNTVAVKIIEVKEENKENKLKCTIIKPKTTKTKKTIEKEENIK